MRQLIFLAGILAAALSVGLPPVSAHPEDAVAHEQCLQCHEKAGIFVTNESFIWNPIAITSIPTLVNFFAEKSPSIQFVFGGG